MFNMSGEVILFDGRSHIFLVQLILIVIINFQIISSAALFGLILLNAFYLHFLVALKSLIRFFLISGKTRV